MSPAFWATAALLVAMCGALAPAGAEATEAATACTAETTFVVRTGPTAIRVGDIIANPPFQVAISPPPAGRVRVRVSVQSQDEYVTNGDSALTDANGIAMFDSLQVFGRPGRVKLVFWAGARSVQQDADVVVGSPEALLIIRQPSWVIVADSAFIVQPKVRLVDYANNPIAHAEIRAELCAEPSLAALGSDLGCVRPDSAELLGPAVVATDGNGEVEFSGLGILASHGTYVLRFRLLAPYIPDRPELRPFSNRLFYDAERESNRSHVVISAIKSIAGEIPRDEFFDARFRFRYGRRLFALASFDVALSGTGSDTVRSNQHFLTEASASVNWSFGFATHRRTGLLERAPFVGIALRIFNTLPYAGVQFGSLEYSRSAFQGSNFSFGVVHRIVDTLSVVGTDTMQARPWNLLIDFFLRSSTVGFFKMLNLRGGVLLPLERGSKVQSRITISVPVGTIEFF